jgi:hypothetical protein
MPNTGTIEKFKISGPGIDRAILNPLEPEFRS